MNLTTRITVSNPHVMHGTEAHDDLVLVCADCRMVAEAVLFNGTNFCVLARSKSDALHRETAEILMDEFEAELVRAGYTVEDIEHNIEQMPEEEGASQR